LLPRWSSDDRAIAFERIGLSFETLVLVVPVDGGEPRTLARSDWIRGHCWRPDGTGLIYSASRGSTMPYPPVTNLRSVDLDGRGDRPLTFGDVSYLEPDMHLSGRVVSSRGRNRSDIWMFPISGSPIENTRNGRRITQQTGQVQTPSVSPDGREVVYVSDNGGHSNLWICRVDGTDLRQITFERDPETLIGIAHWSPRGDQIVHITAKHGRIGLNLTAPDGSGQRPLVANGFGACWSGDGRWVYHMRSNGRMAKVCIEDGAVVDVRAEPAAGPSISPDGSTLYYLHAVGNLPMRTNWELRRARPEDGPSEVIGFIDGARLPFSRRFVPHVHLSPDGQWLAAPLTDGDTTNLWLLPTVEGPPRRVTDFGDRAILIVRWTSWSPDGQYLFAAVAETDVDIVAFDGLV